MAWEIYGADEVWERHRHRYEVNPEYVPLFEEKGLVVSGKSPDRIFVEVVELPDHPWFLACQFHPEFKSRPYNPHPIFKSFIAAAVEYHRKRAGEEDHQEVAKEAVASETVEVSTDLEDSAEEKVIEA
jgi:CTP synthase